MELKVLHGTARSDEHLCDHCARALVRRGPGLSVEYRCGQLHHQPIVRSRMTFCTGYHPFGMPEKWDLEQIAWELKTTSAKMGFHPPNKD